MSHIFFAEGEPRPQGSKTNTPWGGMREASKHLHQWRQTIRCTAIASHAPMHPDAPILLICDFYHRRPKRDYGTGRNHGILKTTAPFFKTSTPDLDKLIRAVADALTGVCWTDDAQVVAVTARKHWVSVLHPEPGVEIRVTPAPRGGDANV